MDARPRTRLLFDEDVSPRVAKALHELGFYVFHVGGEGQPPKGTLDPEVLDHAMRRQETVVTKNHDMIMLCAERGASVVWLDPHGGELTVDRQAAMAFAGIAEWCERLSSAAEPICVRVLRTKTHVYPVAEGAALAEKRYRAIRKRKGKPRRRRRLAPSDQLSTDDA